MNTIKELVKSSKQAVLELISENIEIVSEDRATDVAFFQGFVKAIVNYDVEVTEEEYSSILVWLESLTKAGGIEFTNSLKEQIDD